MMAANTAPVAVPNPGQQPPTTPATNTGGGLLGSLFTPVAPARQAAHMTAPGTPATTTGGATVMSSAAFHNLPAPPGNNGKGAPQTGSPSSPKSREGVVRALLLAFAERWKKGAGANIKRLEIEKVRAAGEAATARTQQVNHKTPAPKTPQVPNRAPAPKPTPSPKPPQTPPTRTGPAPKPAPAPAPKTPAPNRAPAPGPAPKQPSPNTPNRTPAPKNTAPAPSPKTPAPAPAPAPKTVKPQSQLTTTTPAPNPKTTPAKTPPAPLKTKDDKASSSIRDKSIKNNTQTSSKNDSSNTSGVKDTKHPGPKTPRPADSKSSTPNSTTPTPAPGTTNDKASGTGKDTAKTATKVPEPRKPTTPAKDSDKTTTPPTKPSQTTAPKNPGPLFTRPARETGYRDGTRVARTAAKGKAYKDGVKDGWDAVMETATTEKTLLDHARDLRKHNRKDPTVPTPAAPVIPPKPTVPPKPTNTPASAPAPAGTPLSVTGADKTHIHLDDSATRPSLARGEVRNLKSFERRLTARHTELQAVAERTKSLAQHAEDQAAQITRLMEQAKAVKGGEKVTGALSRVQEAVNLQATRAQELHQRAVRAADSTRAVLTNVATRYSGIYQAVVDSDETAPAELSFYRA
ncbi:hypothetical protein [Streptomyces cinereoruber]|uniref:hypothetical protein n=1 Tax=Streptomyces cinereoruber TaxID=67260 RepID=UPI003629B9AD